MKLHIIKNTKIWFIFSSALMVISIGAVAFFGLNLSSDFTEGNFFELRFTQPVTVEQISDTLKNYKEVEIGGIDTKKTSAGSIILRMKRLESSDSEKMLNQLKQTLGEVEVVQNRSVSPVFAQTFKERAIFALLVASAAIILYIAFAFRKVSRGISSWKLGMSAIVALIHDVVITVGVFVILGKLYGVEIDALFITALLTIMGFSVHDTIVVFDRFRENLIRKTREQSFETVAEKSLHQTMARSINTSVSTLIVLVSLLVLGAAPIFWLVFALAVGIVVGTYSSIFIATPLLVLWQKKN